MTFSKLVAFVFTGFSIYKTKAAHCGNFTTVEGTDIECLPDTKLTEQNSDTADIDCDNSAYIIDGSTGKYICKGVDSCANACVQFYGSEAEFDAGSFNGGDLSAKGLQKLSCGPEACIDADFDIECDPLHYCDIAFEGELAAYGTPANIEPGATLDLGSLQASSVNKFEVKGRRAGANRVYVFDNSAPELRLEFEGEEAFVESSITIDRAAEVYCKGYRACADAEVNLDAKYNSTESSPYSQNCEETNSCEGLSIWFDSADPYPKTIYFRLECTGFYSCANATIYTSDLIDLELDILCDDVDYCPGLKINGEDVMLALIFGSDGDNNGDDMSTKENKDWIKYVIYSGSATAGLGLILMGIYVYRIRKKANEKKMNDIIEAKAKELEKVENESLSKEV